MKGFEFPDSSDSELDNVNTENNNVQNDYNSIAENKSEESNYNPYEGTVVNTNPYQNVKIEDVIVTEDEVEEPAPKATPPTPPKQPETPQRQLTDDELTNIEIEKIKAERALKMKNIKSVFVIFMLVVVISISVY